VDRTKDMADEDVAWRLVHDGKTDLSHVFGDQAHVVSAVGGRCEGEAYCAMEETWRDGLDCSIDCSFSVLICDDLSRFYFELLFSPSSLNPTRNPQTSTLNMGLFRGCRHPNRWGPWSFRLITK